MEPLPSDRTSKNWGFIGIGLSLRTTKLVVHMLHAFRLRSISIIDPQRDVCLQLDYSTAMMLAAALKSESEKSIVQSFADGGPRVISAAEARVELVALSEDLEDFLFRAINS